MNDDFIYECIDCNALFEAFEPPFDGKDLCDPCRGAYKNQTVDIGHIMKVLSLQTRINEQWREIEDLKRKAWEYKQQFLALKKQTEKLP